MFIPVSLEALTTELSVATLACSLVGAAPVAEGSFTTFDVFIPVSLMGFPEFEGTREALLTELTVAPGVPVAAECDLCRPQVFCSDP